MDNHKWAVIGVGLAGLVVGAVLGILFAPASGKENRQVLKEKAGKMGECAAEMAHNVIHRGQSGTHDTGEA